MSHPSSPFEQPLTDAVQAQLRPDQRMARKNRFDDLDMDLFFMSALSWGPTGGLDIGQANYVASSIVDGDADSWVKTFGEYGELQARQADEWAARGRIRAAGEVRLKAMASFRSAWQFAEAGGPVFMRYFRRQRREFAKAMEELKLPATAFEVSYSGKTLPGSFLQNPNTDAPVVLVIGGADTSVEDLFLSSGRSIFERGYSVAIVDLPGQGINPAQGLCWLTEPEHAISDVITHLIEKLGAKVGRIALLGVSLGGYFVTRAAQYESRVATVIASSPFPEPGQLFELSLQAAADSVKHGHVPSSAALRSRMMIAWKAGVSTPDQLLAKWRGAYADPAQVTLPFLSIVGAGDSAVFVNQGLDWHTGLASARKELVYLDASTGADGHCQVAARIRLVQEACGWMDEIFSGTQL